MLISTTYDIPPERSIDEHLREIKETDIVIVIGTHSLFNPALTDYEALQQRYLKERDKITIPILMSDEPGFTMPERSFQKAVNLDQVASRSYFQSLRQLIPLLSKTVDRAFAKLWNEFLEKLSLPERNIFENGLPETAVYNFFKKAKKLKNLLNVTQKNILEATIKFHWKILQN